MNLLAKKYLCWRLKGIDFFLVFAIWKYKMKTYTHSLICQQQKITTTLSEEIFSELLWNQSQHRVLFHHTNVSLWYLQALSLLKLFPQIHKCHLYFLKSFTCHNTCRIFHLQNKIHVFFCFIREMWINSYVENSKPQLYNCAKKHTDLPIKI